MKSIEKIRTDFQTGNTVHIAVVGDSTTCGFGANPSVNLWTNGLSYGCVNLPRFGENWNDDNPYYINTTGIPTQSQQDNVGIPSAVRLLRTSVEANNQYSKVYNFGGSGWTAATHVSNNTMLALSNLNPKPDLVLLNLGINSAKNNQGQDVDLRTLVSQSINYGMQVVLVKPHNIGVAYSPSGSWVAESTPDQWYPMDNWPQIRVEIDVIANDYNLHVIDLGTSDLQLDITLLYDSFHPSNLGYSKIASIYLNFLNTAITTNTGFIKTVDGKVYNNFSNENGSFRASTSFGIINIPLSTVLSYVRVNKNNLITSFKEIL